MGIIRNAKLLWYLSPYMDKIGQLVENLGEGLTMSKNVHTVVQMLMTAAQAVNGLQTFVPAKFKIWIMVGLSAIQGLIGVLNHFDPTTATDTTTTITTDSSTSGTAGK